MKKVKIIIISIIVVIIIGLIANYVYATYFSSKMEVQGGHQISILDSQVMPHIVEFDNDSKEIHIFVENTGYIRNFTRVKVFCASMIKLESSSENWELKNGYWYYKDSIEPGDYTGELVVKVNFDLYPVDTSEIIIMADSTEAYWDDNSNGFVADWNKKITEEMR